MRYIANDSYEGKRREKAGDLCYPQVAATATPQFQRILEHPFFHMIWPEMEVIVSSNFREDHICSEYIYIIYIYIYNIYIYIYTYHHTHTQIYI